MIDLIIDERKKLMCQSLRIDLLINGREKIDVSMFLNIDLFIDGRAGTPACGRVVSMFLNIDLLTGRAGRASFCLLAVD